jgi:hypothetical protein
MALPKLKTPEYKLLVPSTQEEISYRPFLVKEQKILMIAHESEDEKSIADALSKLVSECTFGSIDASKSPMFDVEYIFLQIRAKSVGSEVKLNITCPDDGETEVEVNVNIEDINVQRSVEHKEVIDLTDDIKIKFRYPRLSDHQGFPANIGDFERMTRLVNICVESVQSGEETINYVDMTSEDIDDFIDSFTGDQLIQVLKFFETMPKVRHVVNVVNPVTKVKGEVLLEGIESFLE